MEREWVEKGRKVRWEIIGEDIMDPIAAGLDDMTQDAQDYVAGFSWGEVFSREGLPAKTRLLINIATLAAIGERDTLRHHVRAAARHGCSRVEIREALIQSGSVGGLVRSTLACGVAQQVLDELDGASRG
jgi:4-carboxymuconolactone decarboxylase